jgi:hypothetical protein
LDILKFIQQLKQQHTFPDFRYNGDSYPHLPPPILSGKSATAYPPLPPPKFNAMCLTTVVRTRNDDNDDTFN